jgi:hypothetical protein
LGKPPKRRRNRSGAWGTVVKSLGQGTTIYGYAQTASYDGASLRIVPQAYAYLGSFSLLGEYARSTQMVRYNLPPVFVPPFFTSRQFITQVSNESFQIQTGWVLTGEDAAFSGVRLNSTSHSWGALQVVGRYEGVNFDQDAFTKYDPATGLEQSTRLIDPRFYVSGVRSWGLGLNYLPLNNVKLSLNWEESAYVDGARKYDAPTFTFTTIDRETEKVLFTRAQFTF